MSDSHSSSRHHGAHAAAKIERGEAVSSGVQQLGGFRERRSNKDLLVS